MVETRTPRYALPQWSDADTDAPDMADFNEAFLKLDAAPLDLQGTLASRPGPGVAGRYYWASDAGLLARDDGTAWQPVSAAPGSEAPVVTSSAASVVGSAPAYAREDHRHGFNSGTPTVSAVGDAAAQGSASALARSDHRHGREAFGTPVASAPGDATAAGVAATLARSDHVHGREAVSIGHAAQQFFLLDETSVPLALAPTRTTLASGTVTLPAGWGSMNVLIAGFVTFYNDAEDQPRMVPVRVTSAGTSFADMFVYFAGDTDTTITYQMQTLALNVVVPARTASFALTIDGAITAAYGTGVAANQVSAFNRHIFALKWRVS